MDEKTSWYFVEVSVSQRASEAIEFALNELNCLGTESDTLHRERDPNLKVIGYFEGAIDHTAAKQEIERALSIYGYGPKELVSVKFGELENRDWLSEWKKHWKPTETDRFVIAPAWEDIGKTEKIVIRIDPNMAFGTGTHETTKLCLRAIETHYEPGMSFLDVGTGTGILAIAAAKLNLESGGGGAIIACDTDQESIEIARENAAINGANEIGFQTGSITGETPKTDFVCANVTADVIINLLPMLIEKTNRILVLSGILVEQKDEILGELSRFGVSDPAVATDGEWISVVVGSSEQ